MKANGFAEAIGELREIAIHIDPENCAIECGAGTRLVKAVRKFRMFMGGSICDGLERPLSHKALDSLGDDIDATMRRRQKERPWRRQVLPDGSYMEWPYPELQFITTHRSKRGGYISDCMFDVEPMDASAGYLHGVEIARQVLRYRAKHRTAYLDVRGILIAVHQVLRECNRAKVSKRHAASAFMEIFSEMINYAARTAAFDKFIDGRRDSEVDYQARLVAARAKDKADFVERMKAAKAAKRLKAK
ncbi:MAG: hypothetical protein EOO27_16235 [Comamonadaceae bacterium]|nr:MAG: hypothetical protein EOO27_16235 [Comamonadaceae bacterium]